jgi:hypothetical protein
VNISKFVTGPIRIQATNNAIVIENLQPNSKIQVYNLRGELVHSNNPENLKILRIMVQTKGVYFVKINNAVSRIVVR